MFLHARMIGPISPCILEFSFGTRSYNCLINYVDPQGENKQRIERLYENVPMTSLRKKKKYLTYKHEIKGERKT